MKTSTKIWIQQYRKSQGKNKWQSVPIHYYLFKFFCSPVCNDNVSICFIISTQGRREPNHFPQLTYLDISQNNLNCNCTMQSLFLTLSLTMKNFRSINITCQEKEIYRNEGHPSSSYYVNFVGPSGRYSDTNQVCKRIYVIVSL